MSNINQSSGEGLAFAENFARACIAVRTAVDANEGLTLNSAEAKALMEGIKALNAPRNLPDTDWHEKAINLARANGQKQREIERLNKVIDLGWSRGQYVWSLDRWELFNDDYFSPNGMEPPPKTLISKS